ncbi:MAG: hypothetical protein F6J86_44205 [Symploca sp. SIO1B1]|nr:hypothetical protein [Symploca sp. SIO1B1]
MLLEAEGSPDEKIFTTMHENPSLRVSVSPRPRVSFKSGGRRQEAKRNYSGIVLELLGIFFIHK